MVCVFAEALVYASQCSLRPYLDDIIYLHSHCRVAYLDKRYGLAASRTLVWSDGAEFSLVANLFRGASDSAGTDRHYWRLALCAAVYHSCMEAGSNIGAVVCAVSRLAIACDCFERSNYRAELEHFQLNLNH